MSKEDNTDGYLPPYSPTTGQLPVYFVQQPFDPKEEIKSLNGESSFCQKRGWGCKRREGQCCWKDDGRALGTQTHFMANVVFGSLLPFFSLLITFGMETSKLSRVGVLFGHANLILLTAAGCSHVHTSKLTLILLIVFGLLWLAVSLKHYFQFVWVYYKRENKKEEELVRTISQPGCCFQFWTALLISFFFPLFGTAIVLIARRNFLRSRYGALMGFGVHCIVLGIIGAIIGLPPGFLLFGLLIVQFSAVHFRRAIVCAESA